MHKDPLLFKRTVAALSSENAGLFVHVDKKSNVAPFLESENEGVSFTEPRLPVYWGEFSQVEATLLLMRDALWSERSYDYLVFLQGGTYPLRSARYLEHFFEANRGCEFMNLALMPAPGYPLSKINVVRFPSDKPFRRLAARVLAKFGFSKRDYRDHLREVKPFAGHACWALSRAACEYLVAFAAYFRNTFAPDESFFHTILGNSPFRARAKKNLVYADWSESIGHHPAALEESQVQFFEGQDEVLIDDEWGVGEMLFARKFSDDRLDLIDRIDQMITRKDFPEMSRVPVTARG